MYMQRNPSAELKIIIIIRYPSLSNIQMHTTARHTWAKIAGLGSLWSQRSHTVSLLLLFPHLVHTDDLPSGSSFPTGLGALQNIPR